jgi:phosphocarrier protein NPr
MTQVTGKATLCNPKGLHMRAVRELVMLVRGYQARVTLTNEQESAPADSPLELLSLLAGNGCELTITAQGEDAEVALAAVIDLIECGFHELGDIPPTA